jgi:hypothetical protein
MAGLDLGVVECWTDVWLHGRDARPFTFAFTAIDSVSGQISLGNRQPTEIDGRAGGRVGGCGYGSKSGRNCRRKGV